MNKRRAQALVEAVHALGAIKIDPEREDSPEEIGRLAQAVQEGMEAAYPKREDQAAFLAGCFGLYLVIGGPGVPRTLAEALIAVRGGEPASEDDET